MLSFELHSFTEFEITFANCNVSYVGQTKRHLISQIIEHLYKNKSLKF